MNILAIIPARSGSKGVPKKNIKLLNKLPLIGHSIKSAQASKLINKIIISTDSQEIADIAEKFNVAVPFLRPQEFATDTSQDIEFIQHTLTWLQENEKYIPDFIVLLRPTTPIREYKVIDNAIKIMIDSKNATSLRSSHKSSESPFKWFKIKDDIYTTIHEDYTLQDTNKPRQSFEDVYIPNGYVDILTPDTVYKYNNIYGDRIYSYITDVTYEIDTIEEFDFLEYKLNQRSDNA